MYWDDNGQGQLFAPLPNSEYDTVGWKKFREYDFENPHIWTEFEKQTLEAMEKGFQKIGAHFILQIIRWETGIRARNESFKVGNNYFPYYARKFLLLHPEAKGIFDLRKLKGQKYGLGRFATH